MKEKKERIKDRMLKTAARLWGYPDAEVETSFDPVVQLLLEACAAELEKISGEVDVSHARLVERLAQIMMPEPITSSQPAYGILHAVATEPVADIHADHQFYHHTKTGTHTRDLFFSPVASHRLFRGQVQYMAIGNKLYETRDNWFKEQVLQGQSFPDMAPNHLWIGLSMEDVAQSWEGMSFFFDLRNIHQQEMFYHYLPLARVFLNNREVTVKAGYHHSRSVAEEEVDSMIQVAVNNNARYSQHILQRFRRHFLTVTNAPAPTAPGVPEPLLRVFGAESNRLNKDVHWLRIEFPESLHHTLLEDLYCSINCFPVINKKNNEQSMKLNRYLNIIPMQTPDIFFDIKRVYDLEGTDYYVRNFSTAGQMQEGELVIRSSGIGRFDTREAKEVIAYLVEVIRDESSLFEEVKNDYVTNRMRELHQLIASLEEQLQPGANKGNIPYVMVKPKENAEYIFIEFYSTNGTVANNIRMGTRLLEYGNINTRPNSITLLTNTQGGKDRLNIDEKINLYRSHLLSHNRIVTPEDIKALCRTIFGKEMKSAVVSKGIALQPGSGAGYSRTLDIRIALYQATERYPAANLHYMKEELLLQLEEKSSNTFPYRVFINEALV
ncbi:type VI secretion system baseplate subunit TssF [Chitinophaga sp. 22321]|uniref:Type VI secretion system baseplate subunit TssF n=1 Tax=Chitinophaga hostae TaxID=2831022 RepID=A0ABS5JBD9_9BACT|nr:type VI secretion system baseplate subunit TssF [Chitinophaga hostae]MBS0032395.1 type VI secretion system baseplate subunit TssF [Chitinophaga hostae]